MRNCKPATGEHRMSAVEIEAHLREQFPQWDLSHYRIEEIAPMRLRLRLGHRLEQLRPGGTVSGPTLMTLADTAVYLCILAMRGRIEAFTTHLDIHFLAPAAAGALIADTRLLRLGARSAVAEVTISPEDDGPLVAVALASYALRAEAPEPGR